MSIAKEIKQIRDVVKQLLTENPIYRDSDKKLSAQIWQRQVGGKDELKKMSAYDFLCMYVEDKGGKLTSQESIGRARRKLQNEYEELQGVKYKKKKAHTKEVKKALGYTP